MEQREKSFLETAPVKKLLVKFAIPCVLAMLVSALYNIVDQIFILLPQDKIRCAKK